MSLPPGREPLEAWLSQRGERLSPEQWAALDKFLAQVEAHNAKVNITADAGEALYLRHAADAFPVLEALRNRFSEPPKLVDVGAGAGFIGVTLKIAWPEADVSLLESSYRKFGFLNWACAETRLTGLHALLGRAPQALGSKVFDAALLRAVAHPDEAIRLGLRCLRRDRGLCVLFLSSPPQSDPKLQKAIAAAGARLAETVSYRLPGESADRHLALIEN